MANSPLSCTVWVVALGLACPSLSAAQAQEPEPTTTPRYVTVALAANATANVLDMVSTGAGLARGAREENPLLRPLSGHPVVLGFANGAMHVAASYALWKMARTHPKRTAIIAGVLTTLELAVAKHNLDLIRQQPR